MNQESAAKPKKLLVNRDGLKVVRLTLSAGESIPEHSTPADLVVVTVKGEGTFYIDGEPQPLVQGSVLDLEPNRMHAIQAKSDLELIVTHMHLALDRKEAACGGGTCA